MQGEYDLDLLAQLATDSDLSFADMGFSDFDVQMMFGDTEGMETLFEDNEGVTKAKDTIKGIKENREQMNQKYAKEQNADFYFVVVCTSQEEKTELLKQMNVPAYETYVTSKQIKRISVTQE